jgi:cyclophilin family peptidyl-prolyl cis-trans isomerase
MFRLAMYTTRLATLALFVAAAATGCDNRNKPKETGTPSSTDNPPASNTAEPLPTQPRPDPTPAADVRPPTAADLAEYTKDLPGEGPKLLAKIETSMGTFNCELFGDKAPMTVANFIGLATGKKPWMNPKLGRVERGAPYFNGITFHRVIPGFMIQGGDPTGSGMGGPGYDFDDEIWQGQQIKAGVLAMANAGVRGGHGTNGSQFFIMRGRRPDLDSKHTVFGECKEIDLIDKIAGVPTTQDKPNDPVTITNVTISKGK